MKITVLNGSPKGNRSITLQTVLYLKELFRDSEFRILPVGERIKALEKDFSQAREALEEAELIVFCYPVYTFLAPSQLHRFVELVKEHNIPLGGKFAAQITTSKHFYDTTAHAYIRENCADLGLTYLGGLSQDMEDLLKESGRADAKRFWNYILWKAEHTHEAAAQVQGTPVKTADSPRYTRQLTEVPKDADCETVIVTALRPENTALSAMIADFRAVYPHKTRVVDLSEYSFSGGCLGCFHCAATGKCIYRDGFDEFLRKEIQTAAATVYAFTVSDHSMGARFKMYDDRQFCNGHRTVTMGQPVGYLVSGDYENEPNLQLVIEGRADVGGNFLCGVATDSNGISALSDTLCYALENHMSLPQTFLGVGGMKIFRDLIYVMRGMMKADHLFYKKHGFYDFPQKEKATILKMKLVGALISNPKIQAKMGNKMTEGMLLPYRKVLEQVQLPENGTAEKRG